MSLFENDDDGLISVNSQGRPFPMDDYTQHPSLFFSLLVPLFSFRLVKFTRSLFVERGPEKGPRIFMSRQSRRAETLTVCRRQPPLYEFKS